MPAERLAQPVFGDAVGEESARDIVDALNAVVGFAQLLATDDTRLAREQRTVYAEHVREGARVLFRLVPRSIGLEPPTSVRSHSGTRAISRPTLPPAPDDHERVSYAPTISELGEAAKPSRIFVVDRDFRSRELIGAYLAGRGYDTRLLASTADALALAEASPPDLVLLDAAATDAFDLARVLKERDAYLPVVFVTPIGDDGARLRAIDAGAEQYLEKPARRHDVRARVKNLLNLRRNQLELAAQNEQLRRLQAFKDEMAALMVHDLKSPLSAIAMNVDVALGSLPEDGPNEDVRAALEDCRVAGARLFRMIANLLDIARSEDGRLVARTSPVDLRHLVGKIAQQHTTEAKLRHVRLTCDATTEGTFEIDPDLVGRVIENLIENGLRYTRPGGLLRVVANDTGSELEVRVANDGPPIPEGARAHIFEKYGQVGTSGASRVNRGLGLYFCRVAAEAHGGRIDLTDEPGMTTCFRVTLERRLVTS